MNKEIIKNINIDPQELIKIQEAAGKDVVELTVFRSDHLADERISTNENGEKTYKVDNLNYSDQGDFTYGTDLYSAMHRMLAQHAAPVHALTVDKNELEIPEDEGVQPFIKNGSEPRIKHTFTPEEVQNFQAEAQKVEHELGYDTINRLSEEQKAEITRKTLEKLYE